MVIFHYKLRMEDYIYEFSNEFIYFPKYQHIEGGRIVRGFLLNLSLKVNNMAFI